MQIRVKKVLKIILCGIGLGALFILCGIVGMRVERTAEGDDVCSMTAQCEPYQCLMVYLFDSSTMGLYSYQDRDGTVYVQDEEEFEDFIDRMKELCGERKSRYRQESTKDSTMTPQEYYQKEEPVYIMIDDMDKFLKSGKAFMDELHGIMTDAAECGVGIIITVHSAKLKIFDPLSKWVKAASHGLVLSPQGTLNIFPIRSQREYPQMGQGLLFHNGEYITLQLPECR